ncbi:protein mono-ADP-ribosyltransferase PARP10 isoform X2 [Rhineura floridana]|uniref:protein mono-ADP-ribosyltransferase PARP10 isoform X2 n=1 Tax=Rhineura floridana TaxID=261503 RepID=UPI002AC7F930|nr:protein mono-ADP-ribosyltransferase PARP10 isoform X2 [Rhineura floridana]
MEAPRTFDEGAGPGCRLLLRDPSRIIPAPSSMAEGQAAAVEVRGVPPDVADELLVLYFENRRRSGGGPVQSYRRRGSRATLTFESPEDAQRILSRTDHILQDAPLAVQPAAPRDYGKVVLQGLNPQTSLDLLELYVERMLNCEKGDYSVYRSHGGDRALVQLQEPLSNAEFLTLAEQVQIRQLDGASLSLDWVEQTDSLLVRSCGGSCLKQDLLELYFESKRSGGGQVRAVRLLGGGTVAIVSFQDRAVAERVLQRTHRLPDDSLAVSPHYDFLEPTQQQEARAAAWRAVPLDGALPPTCIPVPDRATRQLLQSHCVLQELGAPVPECALALEEGGLHVSGGDPARRQQLLQHIQAALQGVVQEHWPSSDWALGLLQREDVKGRLAEQLAEQGLGAAYVPAAGQVLVVALKPSAVPQATSLLGSVLASFSLPLSERHLPALASPRWAQVQAGLCCCLVRLAESGEQLEGLTLAGLEQENVGQLAAFLQDCMPDETLVPMEAGALRYLQLRHQDLLAGIANVTLLPLEGADLTGLRLSGEACACQAAAELLQSLLSAIHTQTVTLQLPGVSRFLLENRGREEVRDLERRFRCVIGLDRVHWRPLEAQHELELSQEPLALSCRRDSLHGAEQPGGQCGAAGEWSGANLEEIKGLLATLQPSSIAVPTAEAESWALGSSRMEEEEDLYTAPEEPKAATVPSPASVEEAGWADIATIEEGPLTFAGPESSVEEEEAQLLLAIQQSMDSARQEEEQLRWATELSLRSWEQEQAPSPDAATLSAMSISLEEALQAADSVQLVVFVGSEEDVGPLAQGLELALRAQLREETVHSEALQSLPALCRSYLAHLERKHAVRISLAGAVATVCGFADYPVAATRDLALLLTRLLRAEEAGRGSGDVRWVHWESLGRGSPTPYSAQASALLEQAWHRGHKRLDVFFDGRPFTIDFERMEEYDLSSAHTLPIGRIEPPAPPPTPGPPGPMALAEDEVKLVLLTEGSEEFRETVRRFYDTLEDFHNKIRIIKVEKLLHPLLYQQYQLKKVAMQKACGQQEAERVLYHGTTEQSCREICQHGFNRSFCGKNATRYGYGVYFAVKAFISVQEQYSPSSSNGNKYIFVTRVLTGDYVLGSQSMRAPPLREGDAALRRYDSTVDSPHTPAIFVIFNDTQAYPQHLITCRWSKPH